MTKTSKIQFDPLPNAVPEGTQIGDTFDIVCTFKLCDSGSVCLTQMGDVKAEDEDKPKFRPDFKDDAKSIQASMLGGESAPEQNQA
jgi:hypothetical protein